MEKTMPFEGRVRWLLNFQFLPENGGWITFRLVQNMVLGEWVLEFVAGGKVLTSCLVGKVWQSFEGFCETAWTELSKRHPTLASKITYENIIESRTRPDFPPDP